MEEVIMKKRIGTLTALAALTLGLGGEAPLYPYGFGDGIKISRPANDYSKAGNPNLTYITDDKGNVIKVIRRKKSS
jgi:hypothetical protein